MHTDLKPKISDSISMELKCSCPKPQISATTTGKLEIVSPMIVPILKWMQIVDPKEMEKNRNNFKVVYYSEIREIER